MHFPIRNLVVESHLEVEVGVGVEEGAVVGYWEEKGRCEGIGGENGRKVRRIEGGSARRCVRGAMVFSCHY